MDKKYIIKTSGTGYAPHILVNSENPNDIVALCSCGGTKRADGHCDGTHKIKLSENCNCWFCKTQQNRQVV